MGRLRTVSPEALRGAPREAYSLEQLRACYARLKSPAVRDVFLLRAATGLHHTEVQQPVECALYSGPLPDSGVGLRKLGGVHEIRGVLRVVHRKKHKKARRHRVSLDATCLAAAERLRNGVPIRTVMWEHLAPLAPPMIRLPLGF